MTIGLDSDFVAYVAKQPSKRHLVATRNIGNRAANESMMNFVQIATTGEIAGGVLVSQDPPESPSVAVNATVTFTFDRDLPTLAPGEEMVFANSNMRSGGSTVEDNVIEDITVGRGIFLGGIEDVVVQRKVIRATSNAGINISEVVVPAGGGGLPSHGVTIQNNAVENVLGPQASGAGAAINNQAGICGEFERPEFRFCHNTGKLQHFHPE